MGLPQILNPLTPLGSDARKLGDDQIRALKLFISEVFGLPVSPNTVDNAVFSINTSGDISAIRLLGTPIKSKYIDGDDIANAIDQLWFKSASPNIRLVGTEANAKDWRVIEDKGCIKFQLNGGTEAIPVWENRLIMTSTGNLQILSGTAFEIEFDHAATARRVLTLPDATDTLVSRTSTDTLTNKTLSGGNLQNIDSFNMAPNTNGLFPAAVVGSPLQHGLYRENVVKVWFLAEATAGVFALINSFNVASITDGAAGNFSITFDRDFANSDYAAGATCGQTTTVAGVSCHTRNVGSADFHMRDPGNTAQDFPTAVIICGEQ